MYLVFLENLTSSGPIEIPLKCSLCLREVKCFAGSRLKSRSGVIDSFVKFIFLVRSYHYVLLSLWSCLSVSLFDRICP
jgi:hypothetical protein